MNVASFAFIAFAAVVAVLYSVSTKVGWRRCVLAGSNLFFLGAVSRSVAAYVPLAVFLAVGYAGLVLTQRARRTWVSASFIGCIIAAFLWLKKYTIISAFGFLDFPYVTLGLSYIMFRVLQLIIDARDESLGREVALIDYLNFTLNFHTLIAGPIQRYQDFSESYICRGQRGPGAVSFAIALERIVTGLFKLVVASVLVANLHSWALTIFGSAGRPFSTHMQSAVLAAATYPIYLYFNFSGYTDLVIGAARLLGVELPENFNRPFSSPNFIEFWARWHMTLSNFIKTYLYNPVVIALMRRFPDAAYAAAIGIVGFFISFFVMGVWHGQTLIFVFYGFLLGAGVSVDKVYQTMLSARIGRKRYNALALDPLYRAVCRGLTFVWFTTCLFCFWVDWQEFWRFFGSLGIWGTALFYVLLWTSATVVLAALTYGRGIGEWRIGGESLIRSRYVRTVGVTVLACVTLAFIFLLQTSAPDIVYKKF